MHARALPLALAPLFVVALAAPAPAATPTPSATPTATPTATTGPVLCPSPLISFPGAGVDTGSLAQVAVGFDTPVEPRPYTFSLVRTGPAPVATVREVQAASGTVFTVRLGESHAFAVETSAGDACTTSRSFLSIPVRPSLTLHAVRTAPRAYTFSGRVLPGRGQTVGLFRTTSTGSRVLTADGVVGPDGTYRIDRRFLGSGRFGFEVRVVGSHTHLAGASRVRDTVVH